MPRKADYSNTQKYSNRKSFDGQPVPDGKVLVPFLKEKFGLQKGDYIQDNFTTMHLGEFTFEIGCEWHNKNTHFWRRKFPTLLCWI